MTTDLLKQIDDLVASKTFNLDALDGIKKLKDELQKTLTEISMLNDRNKALVQEVETLKTGNKTNMERIEFLNSLVKANEETAKKGQEAIYEAKKHEAVAHAYRDAMQIVFKPNAVRENIARNHVVMVPNGSGGTYPQTVTNTDNVVREDA